MTETKVNSSFLNKLKSTRVNSFQKLPEITGQTLDGFHVNSRLDIMSGEADIYLCSKTDAADSKRYILKYYRRENAVKQDILNKLREVRSPFVAALESYGVYEGHQYVIRPYYEMPASCTDLRPSITEGMIRVLSSSSENRSPEASTSERAGIS